MRRAAAVLCLAVVALTMSAGAQPVTNLRPVLVQGAMPSEIERFAGRLENASVERVGGWTFWRGTVDGYPVLASRTMIGVASAAAATAIAAERYHPIVIINQGTAGGHDSTLVVYDVVLGTNAVNIGAFRTALRQRGEGSDHAGWVPLDQLRNEGSVGQNPDAQRLRRFPGDSQLLAAARSTRHLYTHGRIVEGTIGTSDMWNSELDRVDWFRESFGTLVEEMEAAAVAQVAHFFGIPVLGIRILSNNITNDGAHDARTGAVLQDYVYEVVRAVIRDTRQRTERSQGR